MLDDALVRAGLPQQAGFSTDQRAPPKSRQAQHARLARVRSTAVIATAFLCGHDDSFIDALLHPEFVWLRPLCADTHTKGQYYTHLMNMDDASGYHRLFDRSLAHLLDLGPALATADTATALRGYSALTGLYFVTSLFGEAVAEQWQGAFDRADRSKLFANPHLRMQLTTMGSFVGRDRPHIELLLDETVADVELCDMLCFVRRDTGEQLQETQAALMRGERMEPERCLAPARPCSTIRALGEYALACMRSDKHFYNTGLVLMVLNWIDFVRKYADRVRRADATSREASMLRDLTKRIDHVQLVEKARFFAVVDTLPAGAVKDRLVTAWNAG